MLFNEHLNIFDNIQSELIKSNTWAFLDFET